MATALETRVLKIKVKASTHQVISSISKYICILGLLGSIGFFGYTMVTNYKEASTILSDAVMVDAALSLDDVTSKKSRKRGSTETYHFSYTFEANGENFEKTFTTSESNADKYLDSETIEIAYAKSNPSLSGKVKRLEKNSSIGSLTWRGILALLGLSFLAAIVHGLFTEVLFINKDKPEEEKED